MTAWLALDRRNALDELRSPSEFAPVLVYVLHVEPPCGHGAHYVGSVARHRLRRRLLAHANGYGAAATRSAVRAGARLYLVLLLPAENRRLETLLLHRPDIETACSWCNGRLPHAAYAGRLVPTAPAPGTGGLAAHAFP